MAKKEVKTDLWVAKQLDEAVFDMMLKVATQRKLMRR